MLQIIKILIKISPDMLAPRFLLLTCEKGYLPVCFRSTRCFLTKHSAMGSQYRRSNTSGPKRPHARPVRPLFGVGREICVLPDLTWGPRNHLVRARACPCASVHERDQHSVTNRCHICEVKSIFAVDWWYVHRDDRSRRA